MANTRRITGQRPETVQRHGRIHLNGSRHDISGRAFCHIAPERDDEEISANARWDVPPLALMLRSTHQPSRRR